jgi:hypothetical protein
MLNYNRNTGIHSIILDGQVMDIVLTDFPLDTTFIKDEEEIKKRFVTAIKDNELIKSKRNVIVHIFDKPTTLNVDAELKFIIAVLPEGVKIPPLICGQANWWDSAPIRNING